MQKEAALRRGKIVVWREGFVTRRLCEAACFLKRISSLKKDFDKDLPHVARTIRAGLVVAELAQRTQDAYLRAA